jgi:hypothetical protein
MPPKWSAWAGWSAVRSGKASWPAPWGSAGRRSSDGRRGSSPPRLNILPRPKSWSARGSGSCSAYSKCCEGGASGGDPPRVAPPPLGVSHSYVRVGAPDGAVAATSTSIGCLRSRLWSTGRPGSLGVRRRLTGWGELRRPICATCSGRGQTAKVLGHQACCPARIVPLRSR